MSAIDLEVFLNQQIPITTVMGVRVVQVDEFGAHLSAPLDVNRNHLGTAFGGSIHSLLVLACYTWLFYELKKNGLQAHIVLKSSQTEYLLPIDGELHAVCKAPEKEALQVFLRTFKQKDRARLQLRAHMCSAKGEACWLKGEFVALGAKHHK